MQPDMRLNYLVAINSALLVASDAGGAKLILLPFGFEASVTVISYMLAVSIVDVINEFYGPTYARHTVNVGFVCMLVTAALFRLFVFLPASSQFVYQEAYSSIFNSSVRIALGGWTSYMLSQYLSVWLFDLVKRSLPGLPFILRKFMSDFVVQLIDTALFITIAFGGTYGLVSLIMGQFCVKIVFLLVYTPIAALLFSYIKSRPKS